MIQIIRGAIKTFLEGVYRTFTASGRVGETISGVSYQHYGFRSVPLAGTEVITLQYGNNNVSVAENDGNTAPAGLTAGDVALYGAKVAGDPPYYIPDPGHPSHNPVSVLLTKIGSNYYLLLNADNYIGLQAQRMVVLSDLSYSVNSAAIKIGNLGTDPLTPSPTYYLVTENWINQTFATHTHNFTGGVTLAPNPPVTPILPEKTTVLAAN